MQAGEHILVSGQMDEDQFYFGENLLGRTGLVPSNYVERVPDHIVLQNTSRTPSPSYASVRHRPGAYAATPSPTSIRSAKELPQLPPQNSASSPNRASSPSFTLSVPLHHAQIAHDFTDAGVSPADNCPPLPDSVCPFPPVDISKVTVQELRHSDQPRGRSVQE